MEPHRGPGDLTANIGENIDGTQCNLAELYNVATTSIDSEISKREIEGIEIKTHQEMMTQKRTEYSFLPILYMVELELSECVSIFIYSCFESNHSNKPLCI